MGYSKRELQQLEEQAQAYIGKQFSLENLRVPRVSDQIRERTVHTRGKIAVAITNVDLYPEQNDRWQKNIESGSAGRGPRGADQIYAGLSSSNLHVGIVLQRGVNADTDPLVVINRLMVATGLTRAKEMSWSELLRDTSLGIPQGQLSYVMDAMNFESVTHRGSPVRIDAIPGFTPQIERKTVGSRAHEDKQSSFALTKASKEELKELLKEILRVDRQ